jgi:hypothetical protein
LKRCVVCGRRSAQRAHVPRASLSSTSFAGSKVPRWRPMEPLVRRIRQEMVFLRRQRRRMKGFGAMRRGGEQPSCETTAHRLIKTSAFYDDTDHVRVYLVLFCLFLIYRLVTSLGRTAAVKATRPLARALVHSSSVWIHSHKTRRTIPYHSFGHYHSVGQSHLVTIPFWNI